MMVIGMLLLFLLLTFLVLFLAFLLCHAGLLTGDNNGYHSVPPLAKKFYHVLNRSAIQKVGIFVISQTSNLSFEWFLLCDIMGILNLIICWLN